MFDCVGQVHCSDNTNDTYLEEGQQAALTCDLEFSGSAPSWEVSWEHRVHRLSSINLDREGLLRSLVSFPAFLQHTGVYTCVVTNLQPAYRSQCQVELNVNGQ